MRFKPTRGTRDDVMRLDPNLTQYPCVLLRDEKILLQKMQDGTVTELQLTRSAAQDDHGRLDDGEMANFAGTKVILKIEAECFEVDLPEPLHITGSKMVPVAFGAEMRPYHVVFGRDEEVVRPGEPASGSSEGTTLRDDGNISAQSGVQGKASLWQSALSWVRGLWQGSARSHNRSTR